MKLSVNNIKNNNLKIADKQIVQGISLATATCHTLLLGVVVAWEYIFQVQVMFFWARYKSLYIYINTIYANKTNILVHNACPQVYPLLYTNLGVSPLHGLIVASLRIN